MGMGIEITPELYFSYSQFFVFDSTVETPVCSWTEDQSRQGFARRKRAVAIGTLLEFGTARVWLKISIPESIECFERVIEVPIVLESSRLRIEGPEEYPIDRSIEIDPGHYRLTVAQKVENDERETVQLFIVLDEDSSQSSRILVADKALDPPTPLIELVEDAQ